jgi:signal transduction histidine kinase
VTVRDDGIGIAYEDQDLLFQKFTRAPSAHVAGGTGLGLYIVKGLVEAMGGSVVVRSDPGQGSAFTFSLPAQPAPPAASPAVPAAERTSPG